MTSEASVSMSWVHTVLGAARRLGVNPDELLHRARIAPDELHSDRWPIDHITRLWRAAAALSGDPGFGLKAGRHVGPTSFNVVSFILQTSATLREALGVLQKYQRLISDAGRFQLLPGAHESWLVYHPCQGELAFSPHQIEAVLAATVTFARWVSEPSAPPRLVRLGHARVAPLADYLEAFACPVEFEQAYNGLLLGNDQLDQPLPQADAQLARLHQQYASARLRALTQRDDPVEALSGWIRTHLGPPAPTRAQACAALGLTERTLARRLRDHGQSFSAVLDNARREQALQRVAHTDRALSDIAHELGFADISPFYRAFLRWTGTTPAQWRAQQPRRNDAP